MAKRFEKVISLFKKVFLLMILGVLLAELGDFS